jgi:hypothetical protein
MLRPWAQEHILTTKYISGCNHNPTNQKGHWNAKKNNQN